MERKDVHDLNFREMTKEQLSEESLIDLAYAILEDRKSAISFNDLIAEFKQLTGLTDENIKSRLVQFYTDLNFDGRFLLNHEAGWGLREWYKIETIEEETAPTVKARKKKAKVVDDEDIDLLDEEEIEFVEEDEFDDFDSEDEDDEEDIAIEEDLDFVEEEIDGDIDTEIDEDLIVEDTEDEFLIDEEEDEDFTEK